MEELEKYKDFDKKEFSLFTFQKEDGSFDYKAYAKEQALLNRKKIDLNGPSWVLIEQLSHYVKQEFAQINHKPEFGLCHGTRRGEEQQHFSRFLDIPVLGTDISDTAENFPNTVRWDFHNVVDDWVNNVDFIYSNSLDHSYDPIHCLRQWFKCLRPGGICILAWEKHDGEIDVKNQGVLNSPNGDLFQGTLDFYTKIIKIAGEMDGTTGLKYILNTEYMGATITTRISWDMKDSNWGLWDYHFVIQKISNDAVCAPRPGYPARLIKNS